MPGDIALETYQPVVAQAIEDFRRDPMYAIALARVGAAIQGRRDAKQERSLAEGVRNESDGV